MNLRRIIITSAAVSSLLVLAGAGCSDSTTTTNTTAATNTAKSNTNSTTTNKNTNTATVNTNTTTTDSNTDAAGTFEANSNEANTNDTPTLDAAESTVKEFDVVARQFEFVPGTITVNTGDTVKLNVTSEDVPHGISISAFGVSQSFDSNSTKTIEFVADKAGTYPIVCSVACGAGHSSMKGTLVVQ